MAGLGFLTVWWSQGSQISYIVDSFLNVSILKPWADAAGPQ